MFGATPPSLDRQNLISDPLTFQKFPTRETPAGLFLKIRDHFPYAFLLESMEGPRKEARYSFLGFHPRLVLTAKDGQATIHNNQTESTEQIKTDNPLLVLRELIRPFKQASISHRFCGGAVGYLSYDIIHYWESIPRQPTDTFGFPDLEMGIYEDGLIFDHTCGEASYFFRSENRLDELREIAGQAASPPRLTYSPPITNISQGTYQKLIEKIKKHVRRGDIFQTVLSRRYEFSTKGDLGQFYLALRQINPSPYMYYLKMEDRQIIGSSREMLSRVRGPTI